MARLTLAFVVDILLQGRLLKVSVTRWLGHLVIFWGFLVLLLMHALEGQISQQVFADYYSTLTPFIFLRNLCGILVLGALGVALLRRLRNPALRRLTRISDYLTLGWLILIMASGFFLEASKIISATVYEEMADEYSGAGDEAEAEALKVLWATHYGVVFEPPVKTPVSQTQLALGAEINEMSCTECHSRPQWAFVSYGLSRGMAPMGTRLDRWKTHEIFWWVHVLACLGGLACLPFGKFLHIFSSPLSLICRPLWAPATHYKAQGPSHTLSTALSPDACARCGICSLQCSVAPLAEYFSNPLILPSNKLHALENRTRRGTPTHLLRLAEAGQVCTKCNRCTERCPAGLNLQALWFAGSRTLAQQGFPEPQVILRETSQQQHREGSPQKGPLRLIPPKRPPDREYPSCSWPSLRACFKCQTCTNSCPVVAAYEDPQAQVDALPHQIMYLLSLGQIDEAAETRMIWDCTTCYACQENCPQGVQLTDIFYVLKNHAYAEFRLQNGHGTHPLNQWKE